MDVVDFDFVVAAKSMFEMEIQDFLGWNLSLLKGQKIWCQKYVISQTDQNTWLYKNGT